MDSNKLKKLVIGAIGYHFDGMLQLVQQVGGGDGKAPAAIESIKGSLVAAAESVSASVYGDYVFSERLILPGVDLTYRKTIVSDVQRDDEWIAALSFDLGKLDTHSRKVVQSHLDNLQVEVTTSLGSTTPRRLLVFVTCANKVVTLNPFFVVAAETAEHKLTLLPCVFSWSIPQAVGPFAVVGHIEHDHYQDRLEQVHRSLSVVDSAITAKMIEDHIRGVPSGTLQ